jgi:DNA-directed RNA polymerase specialized sigma24 family protein
MSPLHLRRYRAERLLRAEFDALKVGVLGAVKRRLRASGHSLDDADLEACYSQAWQGLYSATLRGDAIQNPAGWLTTVTFRRAIDEQRSRGEATLLTDQAPAPARDFAAELDDRAKLAQLIEGLRAHLSERERQAAMLCYLQGLSREQAAIRMGIGPRRMQRLMEGRGSGNPGVAAKVGALIESIARGRFCEEHASLMRAFAFGVLDPEGERHQVALAHRRSCPACRAYVLSLRGLSAALPPIFLPRMLGEVELGARRSGLRGNRGGHWSGHLRRTVLKRLGGAGARLGGGGAGGAKVAAAGVALLCAGGVSVVLVSASPGVKAHAPVLAHGSPAATSAAALASSSRTRKQAHSAGAHAPPKQSGKRRQAVAPHEHASISLPAADREFGIERGKPFEREALSAGSGTTSHARSGQAEREFGPE